MLFQNVQRRIIVLKDSTLTENSKSWTHGVDLAAATSCFLLSSINPASSSNYICDYELHVTCFAGEGTLQVSEGALATLCLLQSQENYLD